MVFGTNGNLYISDTGSNQILAVDNHGNRAQIIAAGQLADPQGIAVGPNGNIYVADTYNYRVMEYQENGTFVQQFGAGTPGSSFGQLNGPTHVAVDKNLNVYVWDSSYSRFTVFNSSGTPLTFLNEPGYNFSSLRFDPQGNLWGSDNSNNSFDLIGTNGKILETEGSLGVGLNQFGGIKDFTFDASSNIYVVDGDNRFVRWDLCSNVPTATPTVAAVATPCLESGLNWSISQYEGMGPIAYGQDGNIYLSNGNSGGGQISVFGPNGTFLRQFTQTWNGSGMVFGPDGNLYISDTNNNQILVVDRNGNTVRTMAVGQFNNPQDITMDSLGNIYVADTYNARVMEYTQSGTFIQQFGASVSGNLLGELSSPFRVAVDKNFNVYVWDSNNSQVDVFNSNGSFNRPISISNFSFNDLRFDNKGNLWGADRNTTSIVLIGPNGSALETVGSQGSAVSQFSGIVQFLFDPSGELYVADNGNHRVDKWFTCAIAPTPTPTFAAIPTPCLSAQSSWGASNSNIFSPTNLLYGQDNNLYVINPPGSSGGPDPGYGIQVYTTAGLLLRQIATYGNGVTQVSNPSDIAQNIDGNLYIADTANNRVLGINIYGQPITVLAAGQLNGPQGVATDRNGNIYIADTNNERVLEYSKNGTFVRQLGNGDGGSLLGQLNTPTRMVVDKNLNVYVWEQGNQRFTVFNSSGVAQRYFNGSISGLNSITMDSNGNLWGAGVIQNVGPSISVVNPSGTPVAQFTPVNPDFNQSYNPSGIGFDPSGNVYDVDTSHSQVVFYSNCGAAFVPTPTPMAGAPYVLNVDVGSTQGYTNSSGSVWVADQAYSSGVYGYSQAGQVETSSASISGTNSPALYQTYREGSNLSYAFNLQTGHYQVTLDFADLISTAASQNVFNITINGTVVARNVDIYRGVGSGVATDRSFRVDVTSGTPLTVQLTAVTGNAFVSAFEITGSQPYVSSNPLDIYLIRPAGPNLLP
jgi:sugar lactone lactonase YvrE